MPCYPLRGPKNPSKNNVQSIYPRSPPPAPRTCQSLLSPACFPRYFKLIAGIPFHKLRLGARQPAEHKAESRHFSVASEVPVGVVLVRRLVVVMCGEIRKLIVAPLLLVPFKQIALAD